MPGNSRLVVAALQVSPIALRFEAEHPGAGLPAITDLATGDAAGRVVATFGKRRDTPAATKSQHLWLEPQPPLAPM